MMHLPLPFGAPQHEAQLPPRYGMTMAFYHLKDQNISQRLLLLFGGVDKDGEASNEMICMDVDRSPARWWVVDIAGGPVAARVDSHIIVVKDQFFIFGGCSYGDGQYQPIESYNIGKYDNKHWTWQVWDVPYQPHVPALGFSCDAVAIQDEESPKILLTVGNTKFCNKERVKLVAPSFVLFDIGSRTFTTLAANGDFPGMLSWYGIYNVPGTLKADASSKSAIICTFHKQPNRSRHTELYIYSLPPQGGCRSLDLHKLIDETKKKFGMFAVVGTEMHLFGGTDPECNWNIRAEIPPHWILA
ncbi:hypothetical protein DFH06DRAFT_94295 [Mycena polygramma]|nr:hypothetical protein DFH06DRAFT_94295 [Mycena polygramma]